MTSWLDDLDAAAVHAMLGDAVAPYGGLRSVHVRPERIRALIACVRAGHRMANEFGGILSFEEGVRAAAGNTNYAIALQRVQEFDAARAALEATP